MKIESTETVILVYLRAITISKRISGAHLHASPFPRSIVLIWFLVSPIFKVTGLKSDSIRPFPNILTSFTKKDDGLVGCLCDVAGIGHGVFRVCHFRATDKVSWKGGLFGLFWSQPWTNIGLMDSWAGSGWIDIYHWSHWNNWNHWSHWSFYGSLSLFCVCCAAARVRKRIRSSLSLMQVSNLNY